MHSADGWRAVLEPVVARYRGTVKRFYFRGDAAFANPEIYELLEAERVGYTIRLPANNVLQNRIGHLLKRPAGRPPHEVRRYFASFSYEAQRWKKPRRVVAKVEWHPAELYPRVGFIVTNLARPAERVVGFYNQRGTAEQWIKEGKGAIKWTRLSCRTFAANAARLQLHALTYNLGHAGDAADGATVVADQPAREADQDRRQGRQPRALRHVPDGRGRSLAADVRRHPVADRPAASDARLGMRDRRHQMRQATTAEVRFNAAKSTRFGGSVSSTQRFAASLRAAGRIYPCPSRQKRDPWPRKRRNLANVG